MAWEYNIDMASRLSRVDTKWTSDLAYVVGIITTDGNLSPDGRHINITSKDLEIVGMVKQILGLDNVIGKKARGGSAVKKYFVFQFGDINFYEFLCDIGLCARKSKKLTQLEIPDTYFPDFLRGCLDGDGTMGYFKHPETKKAQFRLRLVSASPSFLAWIHAKARALFKTEGGHIYSDPYKSVSILSFAMGDSRKILEKIYYDEALPNLSRKRLIAERFLKGE